MLRFCFIHSLLMQSFGKMSKKITRSLHTFPPRFFREYSIKFCKVFQNIGGTRCLLSTFHILWEIAAAIFLAKKAKRGTKTGSTHSGFKLITNFPKPRCRNTQKQKVHQLKNWNGCHLIESDYLKAIFCIVLSTKN